MAQQALGVVQRAVDAPQRRERPIRAQAQPGRAPVEAVEVFGGRR
jgi:hypothetical protein